MIFISDPDLNAHLNAHLILFFFYYLYWPKWFKIRCGSALEASAQKALLVQGFGSYKQ